MSDIWLPVAMTGLVLSAIVLFLAFIAESLKTAIVAGLAAAAFLTLGLANTEEVPSQQCGLVGTLEDYDYVCAEIGE